MRTLILETNCFLKLGLIFVNSYASEVSATKKLFGYICSVGCASLCSKSEVMLLYLDEVSIHLRSNFQLRKIIPRRILISCWVLQISMFTEIEAIEKMRLVQVALTFLFLVRVGCKRTQNIGSSPCN